VWRDSRHNTHNTQHPSRVTTFVFPSLPEPLKPVKIYSKIQVAAFLAPSAAVRASASHSQNGGIYRRAAKYNADFKQRIIRSVLEAAAQGFPRGWNQRISTQ
jgi:hypothetical protein